jgi:hypothetical protein
MAGNQRIDKKRSSIVLADAATRHDEISMSFSGQICLKTRMDIAYR